MRFTSAVTVGHVFFFHAGRPIVTKQYPDSDSDSKEEIEVLMQGLARAGGDGRFWGGDWSVRGKKRRN